MPYQLVNPVQLEPLSPVSIDFFIGHILSIRTEALRATVVGLSGESMAAGEAFHPLPVGSGRLILGIGLQEEDALMGLAVAPLGQGLL